MVLNVLKTREVESGSLVTSEEDFELLGRMIGYIEARKNFVQANIQRTQPHLVRFCQLPAQVGVLLLRECVVQKICACCVLHGNDFEGDYQFLEGKLLETIKFFRKRSRAR
jgi:hypothetical protein